MLGILLIYLFAVTLDLLPATGFTPMSESLWGNIESMILPSLTLGLIEWTVLMRVLRSDLLSTLKEDFILLARAKGLPQWRVLLQHALRPSSFTLITIIGLNIGGLIGGAVIVEQIFALPGVGRLLLGGIFNRDLILVQGTRGLHRRGLRARELPGRHALCRARPACALCPFPRLAQSLPSIAATAGRAGAGIGR